MGYTWRARWPTIVGLALAVPLLVAGTALGNEAHIDWTLLGIEGGVWMAAGTVLALAFAVQLLVNSRSALNRERRLVRTAAQLREVSAELDRLARTDPLTGIYNRRAFFDLLGVEFRRSTRYGRQLSVLMLDLDNFKEANDQWGHLFGDHVLRTLSQLIAANVRESDIVGRYGGEEFSVALPESTPAQAATVGEKLRHAVEVFEFQSDGLPPDSEGPLKVTISVGVASMPLEPEQDEFELIRRADQALYDAKRSGKNRVHIFGQGVSSAGAPALPRVAGIESSRGS